MQRDTSTFPRLSEIMWKWTPWSPVLGKEKTEVLMPARGGCLSLGELHTELTGCQDTLQVRLEQKQWWGSGWMGTHLDEDCLANTVV